MQVLPLCHQTNIATQQRMTILDWYYYHYADEDLRLVLLPLSFNICRLAQAS
jgi:hypothetical protein